MYDVPLIKSRINCVQYAQQIGLPIRKSGDRCRSPLRAGADNNSAFSVHEDYWYDFVSAQGGDVIDLCAMINHNGDRGLALTDLARLTGVVAQGEYLDWQQHTQRRISLIQGWHEDLRPADREYLHSRRITDETINRLRIGFTGLGAEVYIKGEKKYGFAASRISVPVYKNGYVVSWVARATRDNQSPKYLKPPTDDYTEYEPWGLHTINRASDNLFIAEGCFDALSIDQSGYPVLATMGGHFGRETLRNVLSIVKNYKRVVLAFDNDEAGRKFTTDLGGILFSRRIPFSVAVIPNKYKDIADFYADGNEIKDLEMQDGVEYLAFSHTDKKGFKQFAYKAARILEKAELAELFTRVEKRETFSSVWLREVKAACFKAPPENIIVSEILNDHKLLYVPAVGFYEYTAQGIWALLNDEIIHGYISDALGVFTAGSKLEPIKKLMRPEVLTKQEFDRKPVISFVNGTLELETGNFRDHSEDDYCSIQLPYPYIPDAKSPRWNKFIEEITASDPKREENLQFIAGYTLFNDCRHEKIFVLTGEGGNGKSIYTRILNQLFGEANVTHITPKGMTMDFECIHLRRALLNIAGEIKSDISGADEKLKQIASGEAIQACYKGKDYVSFQPRAKLIFACNGQLKASDTSDGLARRLLIIDFQCSFVDYPDKDDPYQKQRDIGLYDKLQKELPGIFNWAYEGYRNLIKYGEFTENDDHQALMAAFRRASNPIECFIEDFYDESPDYITTTDLYRKYRYWCEDNGHMPCSANRFHPEFKRITKRHYFCSEKSIRVDGLPRRVRGYARVNNPIVPECSQTNLLKCE